MQSKYFFRSISQAFIFFIIMVIMFGFQSSAGVFADVTDPGTGPGGVENRSNTSNLVLWLDANDIRGNDGDNFCAWHDKSGYANNAGPSNTSFYPTLQTDELNDQSVVRFDGIDDTLTIPDDDSLDDTSGLTIFTVIKPVSIDVQVRGILSKRVDYLNQASYSIFFEDEICANHNCLNIDINNNSEPENRFSSDPYTFTENIPSQIAVIYDGATTSAELFADAALITTTVTLSPTIPNYASDLDLGSIKTASPPTPGYRSFSGDIAEAIIFRKALNATEHTLVENYLSSKYKIDISSSGLDRYDGDTAVKGEYDFNVAGIGHESDGSNLIAFSSGLSLTDNNFLVDCGDYVLLGHVSRSNAITTDYVPAGIAGRWSRDWYFDVTDISTNAGGTVDLTFDFSDSGVAGPTGDASNYKLLSRTSTGNTFSILSYSATLSGDQVTFSGVSTADLESHYLTLGAVNVGNSYTLNVNVTGNGTITSVPAGIDCGSECSQSYIENTSVTLSADPATGWSFSGWAGDCDSVNGIECTLAMDAAKSVSALFTANTYTVTFDANGGTTPVPTSKQVSICSAYGTLATTSRAGYSFDGWFSAPSGGSKVTDTSIVRTTSDHTLYAQWTPKTYTVTFDANGGTAPIPTSKQVTFDSAYGTLATTSRTGYCFAGWFSAASSGSEVTAATIVSTASDHTLYARWTPAYSLLVLKDGNGTGTVSSSPTGIDCGSDCSEEYEINTIVTLTAEADVGSTFTGWSGSGCSGTGDCIVTMDAARTITATFEKYSIFLPLIISGTSNPTSISDKP